MLSCLHSNIPSKHSSWKPDGGELKHYYRGGFIAGLWTEAISLISSRVNDMWSDTVVSLLRSFQDFLLYQSCQKITI